VYEVSGKVSGVTAGQAANIQIFNRSGDPLNRNMSFNPDDGSFSAKLPAGSYTIRAQSFEPQGAGATASASITVAANLNGIRLPLLPATAIPVVVRTEFTQTSTSGVTPAAIEDGNPGRYVTVQLTGTDDPLLRAYASPQGPRDNQSLAVQNIQPGRYAAQITPHGPWYVASASYGQADLLRDDLVVAAGGEARPIEIVLRDDGGAVMASVTSDNVAVAAALLIVPERRSTVPEVRYIPERGVTLNSLAPGDYLLFAFDSVDGLEYTNREALEPYASRASHVTVNSKGSATLNLTLINRGEP
jgi:hypothetical protein